MKNMLESNHRESKPWGSKARPITGITSTALGGGGKYGGTPVSYLG
jgi:hypothetical protein